MATNKNGKAVNSVIVEALRYNVCVEVLWWRHNIAKGPGFIREMNPSTPREIPWKDDNFVVLCSSTSERVSHGHGHWMNYSAVTRTVLLMAHPKCDGCKGTGVQSLGYFSGKYLWDEFVCLCVNGSVYFRAHNQTLREVQLDRYHVVVMVDTGNPEHPEDEVETIGKYTSVQFAEVEAEKRCLEERFKTGSLSYRQGRVIGVRVVERPLPEWA